LPYLEAPTAYAYVCAIYIAPWEEYSLAVFEIAMLKRAFRHRREEVTGRRKRITQYTAQNFALFTSIIKTAISWMMRWELHVTRMRNMSCTYNIFILVS
jgi:hypothetical protein